MTGIIVDLSILVLVAGLVGVFCYGLGGMVATDRALDMVRKAKRERDTGKHAQ